MTDLEYEDLLERVARRLCEDERTDLSFTFDRERWIERARAALGVVGYRDIVEALLDAPAPGSGVMLIRAIRGGLAKIGLAR